MNLAIEIPDNIFFGINETEQTLTKLLKEKLVLELYKSSQISTSQGAKMLSMDIYHPTLSRPLSSMLTYTLI